MSKLLDDTIAAVATPHGRGGIAVIRVSGPDAIGVVNRVWKGRDLSSVNSHSAHLGWLTMADGEMLDHVLATVFRSPNSFTGEDVVEVSVHGSPWIQQQAMNRLCEAGARPAGPGEFSKRAFINGKMDLAQTEAVADMIEASSRAAHRLAMQQMSGDFSRKLNDLRQRLIKFASLLELELDFSEEDVEFVNRDELAATAEETLAIVQRLAHSYHTGRAFKEGIPVAIAGVPNVGKSTLLNHILGEEKAIVSDIPGTTRDVIEGTCEIDGFLFRFYDTAGLRETDDTVERIGIERAREQISRAAVVLRLVDASHLYDEDAQSGLLHDAGLSRDETVLSTFGDDMEPTATTLLIINKTDLLIPHPEASQNTDAGDNTDCCELKRIASKRYGISEKDIYCISSKTGEGIDRVLNKLTQEAKRDHNPDAELIVTNARHYEALKRGSESLERAITAIQEGIPTDLVAQDVRQALHHIGTITGAITTAHLLTSIFSSFCIGK